MFLKKGFAKSSNFINKKEVAKIKLIYNQILDDFEGTAHLRSDLGGEGGIGEEKITQIMCPSNISKKLGEIQKKYIIQFFN